MLGVLIFRLPFALSRSKGQAQSVAKKLHLGENHPAQSVADTCQPRSFRPDTSLDHFPGVMADPKSGLFRCLFRYTQKMLFRLFTNDLGGMRFSALCPVDASDVHDAKRLGARLLAKGIVGLVLPEDKPELWPHRKTGAIDARKVKPFLFDGEA